MGFRDLDDFLERTGPEIPIRGKLYTFPGDISGKTWLLIHRLAETAVHAVKDKKDGGDYRPDDELLKDAEYSALQAELFGPALKEMLDDGLPSSIFKLVFMTLVVYHVSGSEAAENFWNSRGERLGEAPAPTRATAARSAGKRGSPAG